jgi:hypothetical protein
MTDQEQHGVLFMTDPKQRGRDIVASGAPDLSPQRRDQVGHALGRRIAMARRRRPRTAPLHEDREPSQAASQSQPPAAKQQLPGHFHVLRDSDGQDAVAHDDDYGAPSRLRSGGKPLDFERTSKEIRKIFERCVSLGGGSFLFT